MCLKKVFDGKGKEHNLDSDKIGNLEELSTEARDSLVSAVNEVDGRVPKVTLEQENFFVQVKGGSLTPVPIQTEEWVFTMEDDSTLTKKVVVME